jgi:hypothetical protein
MITVRITGESEVEHRLDEAPRELHRQLVSRATTLTSRLLGAVRAAEPRRTGKLAGETRMQVDETPDSVTGRVIVEATGNEREKALALEGGAHGVGKEGHRERSAMAAYRARDTRMIEAYNRPGIIMARRYLRGPFEEMHGEIEAELAEAAHDL